LSINDASFDEYQEISKKTDLFPVEKLALMIEAKLFLDKTHLVEYRTVCLSGEAGELANKIKKIRRDHLGVISKEVKTQIKGELGDILWYLSTLCSILELKLSDVASHNVEVLSKRKLENKIKGEGDNR